ncbi:hypothetical protein HYV10_03835 [Candidatus Dependentiae bacterium]|nr:hypothetical protein [Candidatus Dependentiae bacterium]
MQNKSLKILFLAVFLFSNIMIHTDSTFDSVMKASNYPAPTIISSQFLINQSDFTSMQRFNINYNQNYGFMFNFIPSSSFKNPWGSNGTSTDLSGIPNLNNLLKNGIQFVLVANDSKGDILLPASGVAGVHFSQAYDFTLYVFDMNNNFVVSYPVTKNEVATLGAEVSLGSSLIGYGFNTGITSVNNSTTINSYPVYMILGQPSWAVANVLDLARAIYSKETHTPFTVYTNFDALEQAITIPYGNNTTVYAKDSDIQIASDMPDLQLNLMDNQPTELFSLSNLGGVRYNSLANNINSGANPKLKLVVLAFDGNNNYMSSISSSQSPSSFAIYAFDTTGNILSGFPYQIPVSAKLAKHFTISGNSILQGASKFNYPAVIDINWVRTFSSVNEYDDAPNQKLVQLWVSSIYPNSSVDVSLIYSADGTGGWGIGNIGAEIYDNLGVNNVYMRITCYDDNQANQHYMVVKAYTKNAIINNSTDVYSSIANPLVWRWNKGTSFKGEKVPCKLRYLTQQNSTFKIKMGVQTRPSSTPTKNTGALVGYTNYSPANNEVVVAFKVRG